jgi:hypothetical protein
MTAAARAAVLVALLVVATFPRPTLAIPNQTIPEFKAWAKTRPLLATIAPRRDEMSGFPAFAVDTADHGVDWTFYATTDGKHIVRERLAVGEPGSTNGASAIRHDGQGYGLTFFRAVYGNAIAQDYLAAKLVASVTDPTDKVTTRFYRGKRFGYAASTMIVVETYSAFDIDLALARKCSKSPQDCSE